MDVTHVYRHGRPAGVQALAAGRDPLWPGRPLLAEPAGQMPIADGAPETAGASAAAPTSRKAVEHERREGR